jgi:hypothetical protein
VWNCFFIVSLELWLAKEFKFEKIIVCMVCAEELELIGALIGDGHIHSKLSHHYVGFTGNSKTDFPYFKKLVILIKRVFGERM